MQKLLLLHGALGSAENFTLLKNELSDDFDIHTLNFSGHGGSEVSTAPAIPAFAEEVLHYLNENNIDAVSVFGYSMGGYVGLYLCRHYPEKIGKLFTLATKLNWTPEGAAKESAMLNSETIKQKVPKYADALHQLHGSNWEKLMRSTADMMIDLGNNPMLKQEDFRQINTPVLMAVGDKDIMVSIEETVNAYRLLQNAAMMVLPVTPHPIDKVDTKELAHQIRRYFL